MGINKLRTPQHQTRKDNRKDSRENMSLVFMTGRAASTNWTYLQRTPEMIIEKITEKTRVSVS